MTAPIGSGAGRSMSSRPSDRSTQAHDAAESRVDLDAEAVGLEDVTRHPGHRRGLGQRHDEYAETRHITRQDLDLCAVDLDA